MIRVVNFFCMAVTALTCLALYHVSEQTRVARARLVSVDRQIELERGATGVLQAEWARVADAARIENIARRATDSPDVSAVQLTSLTLLPRRGEATAGDAQIASASAVVPGN
jgi:hypothetical protein